MAGIIPEEGTRFLNPNDIQSKIREYIKAKSSADFFKQRCEELRTDIFAYIDESGEEDSNGSFAVKFDAPIDGVAGLQKSRRATRKLNEGKADEVIEATGIADDVYEMKRVINEGALMAALYEGKITEEQLDEMFPVEVVWALRTLKK
jgi:hypothetical protein